MRLDREVSLRNDLPIFTIVGHRLTVLTKTIRSSFLVVSVLAAGYMVACGAEGDSIFGNTVPDGGDLDGSGGGGALDDATFGEFDADPGTFAFRVEPATDTLLVTVGQPLPTLQLRAMANDEVVTANWSVDRGELGLAGADGVFTPTGQFGGVVRVTATYRGRTASANVTVRLSMVENGSATFGMDAGADGGGAGGAGGVGGEGAGPAISDELRQTLEGTATTDATLKWLYPYDGTVWPRGLLAPLLQWQMGTAGDYDAVYIHLKEANFEYKGFFGKPSGQPFRRHPIPQDVWRRATTSNAGEDLEVSIVLAKGETAYAPATQEKWKVASAPLKGVVYYNSYGTHLAKNHTGALGGDGTFGGATLAIRGGSTDPVLVAGGNGGSSQCRVCHSVSADGSKLITQRDHGDQRKFSTYDLASGEQTPMAPEGSTARYGWPALYPNGSLFLNDSSPNLGSTAGPSRLYEVPSGAAVATPTVVEATGLPADLRAACPAFSPDGKRLAFNLYGMTGALPDMAVARKSLALLDFDVANKAFSNFTLLTTPSGGHTAVWPSFLPTSDAVVYEVETRTNGRGFAETRSDCDSTGTCHNTGVRAELWWLDLATKTPTRLDKLNGLGYLPTGPNAHDADHELNYEPTVNPVPSGGYAWVVFTSRRLYGNVATINPYASDPRYRDISATPTPKKLWVAAIDLNAAPGTDPSHPAFYLPAQELLAGNSRGYWVVDPCRPNGETCDTGDECCGGFCRPSPSGGLMCMPQPPASCSQEFERCTSKADCCDDRLQCINARCARPRPL